MINNFKDFLSENNIEYMKDLASRIRKFIDEYAGISPNWDPEDPEDDSKYTSPDASMLVMAADVLEKGEIPLRCWSEWGNGGYNPYSSKEGKAEHDIIMKELNALINKKNNI